VADSIVVFLGPTLGRDEASGCLEAIYRPPAEQGDIVRAVHEMRARAIVLIDGVFAATPAVRHKEILWALDRGIRIYGAASIGALRAAELQPYGMQGHGFVYRWYRSTPLADDDEVAVAMTPPELGAHALSEALIDIRLTLRRAERLGLIPGALRRELVNMARAIHFVDRTYENLLDKAMFALSGENGISIDCLRHWIGEHAIRQKRDDALSLLRRLAAIDPVTAAVARSKRRPFRMTEAWAADLEAAGLYEDNIL
jgi:hypothetical protein